MHGSFGGHFGKSHDAADFETQFSESFGKSCDAVDPEQQLLNKCSYLKASHGMREWQCKLISTVCGNHSCESYEERFREMGSWRESHVSSEVIVFLCVYSYTGIEVSKPIKTIIENQLRKINEKTDFSFAQVFHFWGMQRISHGKPAKKQTMPRCQ